MPPDEPTDDRAAFESAIQALEAELANIGVHLSVDARAREVYAEPARQASFSAPAPTFIVCLRPPRTACTQRSSSQRPNPTRK